MTRAAFSPSAELRIWGYLDQMLGEDKARLAGVPALLRELGARVPARRKQ